jgi:DNA-binding PadR family transcriptional regulator
MNVEASLPSDSNRLIERVLRGVVNSEPKIILMQLLRDSPLTAYEIAGTFKYVTESKPSQWIITRTIKNNMNFSILPSAFALQGVKEEKISYTLTEEGIKLAQPVAAFALDMENRWQIPFSLVLGTAPSPGKTSSQFNRFMILTNLLERDQRFTDLSKQLNLPLNGRIITDHLNALQNIGLVEYGSAGNCERVGITYRWVKSKKSKDVPLPYRRKRMTKEVTKYLERNGEADNKTIAHYINVNGISSTTPKIVTEILSRLRTHGFAESDYVGNVKLSYAKLTPKGREFAEEFTQKLKGATLGGSELNAMQNIHENYLENEDLFRKHASTAVAIYSTSSPNLSKLTERIWIQKTYAYLKQKEAPATPSEIISTIHVPHIYLSKMLNKGITAKKSKGRNTFHNINSERIERVVKKVVWNNFSEHVRKISSRQRRAILAEKQESELVTV